MTPRGDAKKLSGGELGKKGGVKDIGEEMLVGDERKFIRFCSLNC